MTDLSQIYRFGMLSQLLLFYVPRCVHNTSNRSLIITINDNRGRKQDKRTKQPGICINRYLTEEKNGLYKNVFYVVSNF